MLKLDFKNTNQEELENLVELNNRVYVLANMISQGWEKNHTWLEEKMLLEQTEKVIIWVERLSATYQTDIYSFYNSGFYSSSTFSSLAKIIYSLKGNFELKQSFTATNLLFSRYQAVESQDEFSFYSSFDTLPLQLQMHILKNTKKVDVKEKSSYIKKIITQPKFSNVELEQLLDPAYFSLLQRVVTISAILNTYNKKGELCNLARLYYEDKKELLDLGCFSDSTEIELKDLEEILKARLVDFRYDPAGDSSFIDSGTKDLNQYRNFLNAPTHLFLKYQNGYDCGDEDVLFRSFTRNIFSLPIDSPDCLKKEDFLSNYVTNFFESPFVTRFTEENQVSVWHLMRALEKHPTTLWDRQKTIQLANTITDIFLEKEDCAEESYSNLSNLLNVVQKKVPEPEKKVYENDLIVEARQNFTKTLQTINQKVLTIPIGNKYSK